jgi:putative ABC transport system substrate-binding protein
MKRRPTPSLPGLTPQVGSTRLAALDNAKLGQARVSVQSIFFRKKKDARVKFTLGPAEGRTRVLAHDEMRVFDLTMKRREFLILLGGAAASFSLWPFSANAQPSGQARRLGVLMNGAETDPELQSNLAGFVQGLRKSGWIDGRNLHIDYRWNGGDAGRARAYAAELVGLGPDVILSASTTNLAALQRATQTTPIVFMNVSDPVAQGFVPNLTRPGGNITGFSTFESSVASKWLDLLKQIEPGLARVAFIFNPATSPQSKIFVPAIETAAPSMGVDVLVAPINDATEIEPTIARYSHLPNVGLIFPTGTFTELHHAEIVDLVARYRLPAIYASRRYVNRGGLMFYGSDPVESARQAAGYVDRILKGAKPGDLPVQLPTNYKLVINLKAARALGIELPMGLLIRADEVIE